MRFLSRVLPTFLTTAALVFSLTQTSAAFQGPLHFARTTRSAVTRETRNSRTTCVRLSMIGGKSVTIPKSAAERDSIAIRSIETALKNPRVPSFRLIECEFPPLESLNKLGDGSLRSALEVDSVNLQFCQKLLKAICPPLPFLGPKPWLLTSVGATSSFYQKAVTALSKANTVTAVHSLKEGLPSDVKGRDVFVLASPSSSRDYAMAQELVKNGNSVILVNGLAKDTSSVPGSATMAFFLKPLTYNSQVAGYLVRSYPSPWSAVLSSSSKGGGNTVLATYTDDDILVPNTNTPDLRAAVRQVQVATDQRAAALRKSK